MQRIHDLIHTFSMAFSIARRILAVACLATAVLVFAPVTALRAAVVSNGHVTPVDFVFTPENEGLPPNGNFLDINQVELDPVFGTIISFFNQITWEGYVSQASDLGGNPVFLGVNTNANILVGASEFANVLPGTGSVQINSGSELRFMDLIIGGNTASIDPTPSAHGTVEISGPGSLFNSDYTLIPPEAVPLLNSGLLGPDGANISVNPRADETGATEGFDLRLGVSQLSTGVLSITAGGVAEIHDSIIVGEAAGAVGIVTVDGIGSVLQGGGNIEQAGQLGTEQHMMIVGQRGTGTMNILNGGRVIAKVFDPSDNVGVYSAAIGDNPILINSPKGLSEGTGGGGSGTVNVDGAGSLFSVASGLLVGSFSQPDDTPNSNDFDVQGNDVRYAGNSGSGTLNITDGGQLLINTPTTGGASAGNLFASLSIGRFGRVFLNDGHVGVGNPDSLDENAILTNDGLISGHGRIETGIFRNRLLGEVEVGLGEELVVVSGAAAAPGDTNPVPDLEEQPMVNYGVIHVDRGKIEFLRAEDGSNPSGGVNPGDAQQFQPFRNAAITAGATNDDLNFGRSVGEIKANNATLNFQTGLDNQGRLIFYGGDNNILFGNVTNRQEVTLADDANEAVPAGEILISGDETFATFNGNVTNDGYMEVGPSATGFQVIGDFTMTDSSRLVSRIDSSINVLGAADLAGVFQVLLPLPGEVEFDPQHGDVFTIFHASEGITTRFDGMPGTLFADLPFLGLNSGFIPLIDLIGGTIDLLAFDVQRDALGNPLADLNGDGVVDEDDITIYNANRGNPGGLGDINGDGIVNALDLGIIFDKILAGGIPGSGTGSSVPEPASVTLVLLALIAMLGSGRRFR